MAMKNCPVCGENYSDTYRECPFCEEDKMMRKRKGRGHGSRSRGYSMVTPTLVVLILIMGGLLTYLLYGDKIAEKLGKGDEQTDVPGIEQEQGSEQQGTPIQPIDPEAPEVTMPEDPDPVTPPEEQTPDVSAYDSAAKLPDGLVLANAGAENDFTLKGAGTAWSLKVSGGSGNYTWISKDPKIATVDNNGKVLTVSDGHTTILVTDGSKKATCIVRVSGAGKAPSGGGETTTPTTPAENHELNRTDFTIKKGETFRLRVSGLTTGLTWTIDKTSVATISDNGTVTGVGKGQAKVTVTWDGGTATCIVRCTG
ncbi:MAG: hypothetical protein E7443_00850 [Ruminococcaceae bacterium]|nr:hypothetical protein [Oscillospiraceae bacterium]